MGISVEVNNLAIGRRGLYNCSKIDNLRTVDHNMFCKKMLKYKFE